MSAPGEYGGVSTSDETLQSTFSSTRARAASPRREAQEVHPRGHGRARDARHDRCCFNGLRVVDGHSREHHADKTGERLAHGLLRGGRHRITRARVLGVAAVVPPGVRAAPPPEIAPDAPLRVPHPDGRHGPRALLPVFGSLLLADAGSALGTCVGGYLAFVGLAMLYVSRSAVAKLRALMPRAAEASLRDAFARHDSDSDGKLSKSEFAGSARASAATSRRASASARSRSSTLTARGRSSSTSSSRGTRAATGRWLCMPSAPASPRPRRARPGSPR